MTPTWQAAPGRYETMPYRRCGTSGLKLPAERQPSEQQCGGSA